MLLQSGYDDQPGAAQDMSGPNVHALKSRSPQPPLCSVTHMTDEHNTRCGLQQGTKTSLVKTVLPKCTMRKAPVCSSQTDGVFAVPCCSHVWHAEPLHTDLATLSSGSRGGLRALEWTGSLVPQGALVKGRRRLRQLPMTTQQF